MEITKILLIDVYGDGDLIIVTNDTPEAEAHAKAYDRLFCSNDPEAEYGLTEYLEKHGVTVLHARELRLT